MTACSSYSLVDAHFNGTITLADERVMRAHLDACSLCRRRYERRLVLAELDPNGLSGPQRIGRPLGLSLPKGAARTPLRFFSGAAAVAVLAVAALLMIMVRPPKATEDGFAARGSGVSAQAMSDRAEGIRVFRVPGSGSAIAAGPSLGARDELAFAYENPRNKPYLMIFGVDESRRVYWFHPAWSDESQTPRAIAVSPGAEPHELREAIRHPLAGKRLEIHGLFLDRPLDVREVERKLAERSDWSGALAVEGGMDHVVSFETMP